MSYKYLTTKSFPILFALDWLALRDIASDKIISEKDFLANTSKLFNSTLGTDNWQRSFIFSLRNLFKYVCESPNTLDAEKFKEVIHIPIKDRAKTSDSILFELTNECQIKRSEILRHFIFVCYGNIFSKLQTALNTNSRHVLERINIDAIKEEKRTNELQMKQRGYGNKIFVPYHYLCNTSPTFKECYELYPIEFMEIFDGFLKESESGTHYKLSRNLLFAEKSEMFYLSNEKLQLDLLDHLQVREFQDIRCKMLSRFLDYCQSKQKSILVN